LKQTQDAKDKGYTVNLFLDPREGLYVEEFATSNFAALSAPDAQGKTNIPSFPEKSNFTGKRTYVTPNSPSILASITNKSLTELAAKDFNWKVCRRRIAWTEVSSHQFAEIVACGTAVVITPIGVIHREIGKIKAPEVRTDINTLWEDDDRDKDFELEKVVFDGGFEGFTMLYNLYRNIQNGDCEDKHNWLWPKEGI
jgi:branched-chain amino acid aminotransferase